MFDAGVVYLLLKVAFCYIGAEFCTYAILRLWFPETLEFLKRKSGVNFWQALLINIGLQVIGNVISGPRKVEGPRADLSRPMTADPGAVITEVEGVGHSTGHLAWFFNGGENGGPIIEVEKTTSSGNLLTGVTETTTFSYYATFQVLLCKTDFLPGGQITGIRKIWANDKLFYDAEDATTTEAQALNGKLFKEVTEYIPGGSSGVGAAGLISSLYNATELYIDTRLYTGEQTQQPDDLIVSQEGAAPAHRGYAHIVFQNLKLKPEWGGQIPRLRFEIIADGNASTGTIDSYGPEKYLTPPTAWYVKRIGGTIAAGWTSGGFTSQWAEDDPGGEPFASRAEAIAAAGVTNPGAAEVQSNVEAHSGTLLPRYHSYFYNGTGLRLDGLPTFDLQLWSTRSVDTWYAGSGGAHVAMMRLAGQPAPAAGYDYSSTIGPTGSEYTVYFWSSVEIGGEASVACGYSCPVGDPLTAGEPVKYPEDPDYCIDINGDISLNGGSVADTGTYKCLKNWSWEIYSPEGIGNSYNPTTQPASPTFTQRFVGPVLKSTDANYNSQAFWEAAAAARGVSGTYGVDYPVTITAACKSALPTLDISPNAILLKDVIARDCLRVGIPAADLNFTGLDAFYVDGRSLVEMTSPADRLEEIRQVYQVDTTEYDGVLHFIRRLNGPAVTVPFTQFGAIVPGGSRVKPLQETRPNEPELPRITNLLFYDHETHAQGKQTSERLTVGAQGERTITSTWSFGAQRAADVVDVIKQSQWAELYGRVGFQLSHAYSHVAPGDWITTTDNRGRTVTIRVETQKQLSNGLVEIQGVIDRMENYVSGATGIAQQLAAGLTAVGISGPSLLRHLTLPNLNDEQDTAGVHFVVVGLLAAWTGANVQISPTDSADQSDWSTLVTVTDSGAILATLAGAVAIADSYTILPDDYIDIWVRAPIDAPLYTKTNNEFLNAGQPLIVGGEIILWRDAAQNADGSWRLSNLLRGWRNTTVQAHAEFDEVVIGDPEFVTIDQYQIGQVAYWRALNDSDDPTAVATTAFTYNGETITPWPPYDVFGVSLDLSTLDLTVTITERRRLGNFFNGYTHSDKYLHSRMDILDGATVVRSLTSSTESFVYTKAQQVADWGAVQTSYDISVVTVNSFTESDAVTATLETGFDFLTPDNPDLLAMWTMDNITGSPRMLIDETGNGNDGTIVGATAVAGQIDNALRFVASNQDEVNFGNILNPVDNGGIVSFSALFKTSSTGIVHIMSDGTSGPDYSWGLYLDNGTLHGIQYNTAGGTYRDITQPTLADGNWHSVYYYASESYSELYVDGVREATSVAASGTWEMDSAAQLVMGGRDDAIYWFDGDIDHSRFWNRQLIQAEVTDLHSESGI